MKETDVKLLMAAFEEAFRKIFSSLNASKIQTLTKGVMPEFLRMK